MKNEKNKSTKKTISKLDKFEVLSFNNSSKITGGGTCEKSGGGGNTNFPTAPLLPRFR